MRTRRAICSLLSASLVSLGGCADTVPTRESDGEADRRREILGHYDGAIAERNDAIETRDVGIELFNAEAYVDAIDEFETALDHFETALEEFETAADLAAEVESEAAVAICADAAENTRIQIEATNAGLAATRAANDGEDAETINDHVMTYQELLEEAEAYPIAEGETLAEQLDF